MKHFLLLTGLLLIVAQSSAQLFGALGTEWEHCAYQHLQDMGRDSILTKSVSSQTKYGLACHTIYSTAAAKGFAALDSILLCNDNDKVYYEEQDSLHLLYDFSLVQGDTIMLRYPTAFDPRITPFFPSWEIHFTRVVDSVSTVIIDGIPLKKQYLRTIWPVDFDGIVYTGNATERIGYDYWVVPLSHFQAGEAYWVEGLAKFSDQDISITNVDICFISDVEGVDIRKQVQVFPNPVQNYLQITTPNLQIDQLTIANLTGQQIFSKENLTSPTTIPVAENLPPGIYLLTLVVGDQQITRKLIKE